MSETEGRSDARQASINLLAAASQIERAAQVMDGWLSDGMVGEISSHDIERILE